MGGGYKGFKPFTEEIMARGAILFGTLEEFYLKLASFVVQNFVKFQPLT